MRIKLIKFYQGITLKSAMLTSFTPDEYQSDKVNANGNTAEVVDKGVMVYSSSEGEKRAALVPWNNIAYIQYDMSKPEAPKATASSPEAAKPSKK